MSKLAEPLKELFTRSKVILLDFSQIVDNTPTNENIEQFFSDCVNKGLNPRLPENRQHFNNLMLSATNARYLIGRYGEDRAAMLADTPAGKEGRTIHMAIDIFSKNLEPVMAPTAGTIVRSGYEEGFGEYGNYLVLKPKDNDYYIFFGHLASNYIASGEVEQGQVIARLGGYRENENGGWSRHLHIQILTKLPPEGQTPNGYSNREQLGSNQELYPNPLNYFPGWKLQ